MDQSEYVIIQEGQSVECPAGKQIPFVSTAAVMIGFGGYSTVYKEIILPGRFRYKTNSDSPARLNQTPLAVARKWFPYTPDFDRELLFLETLNAPPNQCHDRIVKHMAVVIDGNSKHSILFPLAEMDLEKYLRTEDFSRFRFKDLVKELFGLADAFCFLHGGVRSSAGTSLVGCHMDLSLANILVFGSGRDESPVGTWKITDFSTSTLTREDGYEYLLRPKLVPDIDNAPEIGVVVEENRADPACDIWSFGCLIFEVLVGYVEGTECRSWKDKHGNSRCYYEGEGEEMRVESRVWNWLNAHITDDSVGLCRLLVMDMLRIDPKERLTAEQVRDRLAVLL